MPWTAYLYFAAVALTTAALTFAFSLTLDWGRSNPWAAGVQTSMAAFLNWGVADVVVQLLFYLGGRRLKGPLVLARVDMPDGIPEGARALLATTLACMAKPTGVTVPLMMGASAWILGPQGGKRLRRLLPFLLAPVLFLLLPQQGIPLWVKRDWGLGARDYALEQLGVVVGYMRRAAFPFPLPFFHDRVVPLEGIHLPVPWGAVLPCGALLLAAGLWILLGPGRHRLPRLGLALFLAPLLLESSIFPLEDTGWNHRCYPGLLGAALVFAWAAEKGAGRRLLPVAALGLLGLGSLHETRLWTRPGALLRRDVRNAFHVDVVWGNYGWSRLDRGDAPGAERLFRRGLESPWRELRLRLGLAASWAAQGRRDAARAILDEAIRDFPAEGWPYRLAFDLAFRDGDPERVEALARKAEGVVQDPELSAWLERWRAAR